MKFAVGMGRNEPVTDVGDLARTAEEAGFSYVTFVDQPGMSRDVNVCMAVAAQHTERIRIAHGVIDPATHRPWVIACACATLNELSGGRQFIALGAGGPFGKKMKARPLAEIRQTIEFLRKYMRGEVAEYDGVQLESEWIREPLPIYIGGSGPKMCQLAGEIADGVMLASNADPVHVQWQLEQIERGAERAGRSLADIDVWARGMIYVTDSIEEARREVAGYAVNSARQYDRMFRSSSPDVLELRRRIDRERPGLVEDCERVAAMWTPEQHEKIDTPAAAAVSDRIIDAHHLVGRRAAILDKLETLRKIGIETFATVTYTIIRKKEMVSTIGRDIISAYA